jgi:hypothetical protein
MINEEEEAFGRTFPGPSRHDLLNHSVFLCHLETGQRVGRALSTNTFSSRNAVPDRHFIDWYKLSPGASFERLLVRELVRVEPYGLSPWGINLVELFVTVKALRRSFDTIACCI